MAFSDTLKSLRMRDGLTQTELANVIGVSSQAVSRWELGKVYPEVPALAALAEYFHVTTDYLLGRQPRLSEEAARQLRADCLRLFHADKQEEAISRLKTAVDGNPDNVSLALALARLYVVRANQSPEENRRKDLEQAESLLEHILVDCRQEMLKAQAEQLQIIVAYKLNRRQSLMTIMMPQLRWRLAAQPDPILGVSTGNDLILQAQGSLYRSLSEALAYIVRLTDPALPTGQTSVSHLALRDEPVWAFSTAETMVLLDAGLQLFDTFFGDSYFDDLLSYAWMFARRLSLLHLEGENPEKAYGYLRRMVDFTLRVFPTSGRRLALTTFMRQISPLFSPERTPPDVAEFLEIPRFLPAADREEVLRPFSATPAFNHLNAFNWCCPIPCDTKSLVSGTLRFIEEHTDAFTGMDGFDDILRELRDLDSSNRLYDVAPHKA